MRIVSSMLLGVLVAARPTGADSSIPHLRQQGTATQLVVDGKPFLIRGGETRQLRRIQPRPTCSRSGPSLAS